MVMKVYYAHPMSWYGTAEEAATLDLIRARFPEAEIVNPAELDEAMNRYMQDNPESGPMEFFRQRVQEADILVASAFLDYQIGSGVAVEILEARIWDKPSYLIDGGDFFPMDAEFPLYGSTLTVEETRKRVRAGVI